MRMVCVTMKRDVARWPVIAPHLVSGIEMFVMWFRNVALGQEFFPLLFVMCVFVS